MSVSRAIRETLDSAGVQEIKIRTPRGKWVQTYIRVKDGWQVQAPFATKGLAGGGRILQPAAELALRLLTAGFTVGQMEGVPTDSNNRSLHGLPDKDGLVRLGAGIPAVRPETLSRILDMLLAAGVNAITSDQLTEVITARR